MTGGQRVLERLRQGPATAAELYRLGVIVHSRVSDLRRDGYNIVCERVEGTGPESYVYTLSSVPTDGLAGQAAVREEAHTVGTAHISAPGETPSRPAGTPVTRTLDAADVDAGAETHPDQLDLLSAA